MAIYRYFRWWPILYRIIYDASNKNHNEKIVHQKIAFVLNFWDKTFLLMPVLFIVYTKLLPGNKFLNEFTRLPIIDTIFAMFAFNNTIFTLAAIFLYTFSNLYKNTLKVHRNEAIVSSRFHSVNHNCRDFINNLVLKKNEGGIFIDYANEGCWPEIEKSYCNLIRMLCGEAQRAMCEILNDNKCYISIKVLTERDRQHYVLKHFDAYPDEHKGEHVNNLFLRREVVHPPKNLFELIISEFNRLNKEGVTTWNLGLVCNDLRGQKFFDKLIIKNNFEKYSTCIILPITYNAGLWGFFCFNSGRVGMLREKHKHFLAGYCDEIANIFRNLTRRRSVTHCD